MQIFKKELYKLPVDLWQLLEKKTMRKLQLTVIVLGLSLIAINLLAITSYLFLNKNRFGKTERIRRIIPNGILRR